MAVTVGEIAPGIDDSNHGLAGEIFSGIPHLLGARAVAKRTHGIARKPAMTA